LDDPGNSYEPLRHSTVQEVTEKHGIWRCSGNRLRSLGGDSEGQGEIEMEEEKNQFTTELQAIL
jgi:hypothetical protein